MSNILSILSPSETSVYSSALERSGVFRNKAEKIEFPEGIIFFDGSCIHPLGKIEKIELMEQFNYQSILVKKSATIENYLNEKNFLIMKKEYMEAEKQYSPQEKFEKINDLEIKLVNNEKELFDFCVLKSDFIFEESEKHMNPVVLFDALKEYYPALHPVLMRMDGKVMGMVSSNFNSPHISMVNMLYIDKKYIKHGYGKVLFEWYLQYLGGISRKICLFCSPENSPAISLYKKLNFIKKDELILGFHN